MGQRSDFNGRPIRLLALGFALGLPLSTTAQHKPVGPGGTVSHSDRQPGRAPGKVEQMDTPTTVSQLSAAATLPFELRQTVGRYPVTLYGQKGCEGCDAGRQYLRQRGIPYHERVVNDGDGEALERATGAKQLPVLMIGSQVLRGYSAGQWTSYLDAAGYPKQSRLPAGYAAPEPMPLVAAAAPVPTTVAPTPPPPAVAPPPAPSGIRF